MLSLQRRWPRRRDWPAHARGGLARSGGLRQAQRGAGQAGSEQLVSPLAELAEGTHLRHAVAPGCVLAYPGIAGVPVLRRLGIKPVDRPDPATGGPQQLRAWLPVVGPGIAADDEHGAGGYLTALLVEELPQHRAVVAVAIAANHTWPREQEPGVYDPWAGVHQ